MGSREVWCAGSWLHWLPNSQSLRAGNKLQSVACLLPGCWSTEDQDSEWESISEKTASRQRAWPPHCHGDVLASPACPAQVQRGCQVRSLKDHRRDHEKYIIKKENIWPAFPLPHMWDLWLPTYVFQTLIEGPGEHKLSSLSAVSAREPSAQYSKGIQGHQGRGFCVGTHDPNYNAHTFYYMKRTVC